jgi:GT2 family glycosyltransferase
MHYSVSVLVPNYNGKQLLKDNMPGIIAALIKAETEYEIIVSDDASTDNSIGFLQEHYPGVKIIRSEINSGFSHAINQGLRLATKTLVLLLNSDVKLRDDYFQSQWNYFDDPDTFGVMGSIWTEDGMRLMDSAKYPVWKGGKLETTINYQFKRKSQRFCYTLFLSGANALIDRKKIVELQGMNEQYSPYYMEDVDLSVRAWRKGWKCYYEQQAVCYHKLSETIATHSTQRQVRFIANRNKFIFHYHHLLGTRLFLWRIRNCVNFIFRWLALDMSYYKSYFAYIKVRGTANGNNVYVKTLQEVTDEIIQSGKREEIELF